MTIATDPAKRVHETKPKPSQAARKALSARGLVGEHHLYHAPQTAAAGRAAFEQRLGEQLEHESVVVLGECTPVRTTVEARRDEREQHRITPLSAARGGEE